MPCAQEVSRQSAKAEVERQEKRDRHNRHEMERQAAYELLHRDLQRVAERVDALSTQVEHLRHVTDTLAIVSPSGAKRR
jgi:polyhydroxyalkanoate synthesis regulator phasin